MKDLLKKKKPKLIHPLNLESSQVIAATLLQLIQSGVPGGVQKAKMLFMLLSAEKKTEVLVCMSKSGSISDQFL
jgi:hypothetical protein